MTMGGGLFPGVCYVNLNYTSSSDLLPWGIVYRGNDADLSTELRYGSVFFFVIGNHFLDLSFDLSMGVEDSGPLRFWKTIVY